jgi:alpha-D-xyloside xylohydrolase
VLERYTALTGKPALPPAWSFGLWLSTSFTTNYDEQTTSSFIDGMQERDIPLRVFHFDCYWMKALHWCDFVWDEKTFANVPEMLKRYKEEKGLKICVWINPYIAQGTAAFQEAVENGYLLRRADGRGFRQTDNWQPGMGWVDFTNPEAVEWYTGKLKTLLDAGVDCLKTDFAERIPIDVTYFDGSDPLDMHNYYTYLYNKTVFELLEREKGKGEAVLFARSATAGGQQFPVHWGGDCSASYISMAETLRAGLSFAMSGFSFWSHDISGFEQTASPDLYKRWVQFGMFSTHSRLHGSTSYRVPWLFDEEACDVVRFFTRLKCSMMPYLYQMAVYAHETGVPLMRPMVLEFPDEPGMKNLEMQYMLGDSLLVAPIFREDGMAEYYLPEGKWSHLIDGEIREGGRWYREKYDYFSLPVYVRENTIFPMKSGVSVPDYDYRQGTEFHLYCLKDGKSADCFVTDVKGGQKLSVRAVREGSRIKVDFSEITEGMKLVVHTDAPGEKAREIPVDRTEMEVRL